MVKLLKWKSAVISILILCVSVIETRHVSGMNNHSVHWDSGDQCYEDEKLTHLEDDRIVGSNWSEIIYFNGEFLEDDLPSGNKWSRRSLCGIMRNENHRLKEDYYLKRKAKKTLLDYEKFIPVNNLESAAEDCSSAPHVRVKRRNALQHGNSQYLKQLAESFPRDSINDNNITKSESKNGSYKFPDDSFTTDVSSVKCNRTVRSLSEKSDCNNIEADNAINNQNKIKEVNVHSHKRHLGKRASTKREKVRENKKSSGRKGKKPNRKIKRADMKSSCISQTTNVYESDTTNKLNNYETSPSFLSSKNQFFKNEETGNNEKNYYSVAIESAEEVEDLAKKLVVKVDELENYLRYKKESINNKKIDDLPAIDDLCLNVTAAYKRKKEPTKVIRRCLPAPKTRFRVKAKTALKRNVNTRDETGSELVEKGELVEKSKKKRFYKMKIRRDTEEESHQKWGRWTDWSSCSVTCGKGRQIKWRYCLNGDCSAEIEMGEKACQLPACPPRRFLGIF